MESEIVPYSDPNLVVVYEYKVDRQLVRWESLSIDQKELMMMEKAMNSRTSEDIKLIRVVSDKMMLGSVRGVSEGGR